MFLISLSIEMLQLIENITYLSVMAGRTVNIDDLILSTIAEYYHIISLNWYIEVN